MKIGVLVDCMKLDVKKGVAKAREMGFDGIQVYATQGELAPENLSKSGRQQFRDFVAANRLELAALVGDVGGFDDPGTVEQRVDRVKQVLALAGDLRTPVVSAHIGFVDPEETGPRRVCIAQALEELGACGEKVGVFLLDSLKTESIKVNYDPANLVMVAGDDPIAGVTTVADYIVHVHAKDGKKKGSWSPAELQAVLAEEGENSIRFDEWFEETPLGEGDVDIPLFIEALAEIGYHGFLTIERETGDNPVEDIRAARDKLHQIFSQSGE
jgi:L-ribulose-5-phosphate 3-epimerase